jgi:transposase
MAAMVSLVWSRDLGGDPLWGDPFLLVNKRRKGCKVLVWDGTGLCIFQKRLERGTFASRGASGAR